MENIMSSRPKPIDQLNTSNISKKGPSTNPTLLIVVNVDWAFLNNRLQIAQEALRLGYSVHIATGITSKLDELQGHGFEVHPLALERNSIGLINTLRTLVQLYQINKTIRPDIVHLVTIKPVLLGGLIARLTGVPAIVAAVPGLGFVFMAQGVKATIRRYIVGLLYRITFGHRNLKVIFQNIDDLQTLTKLTELPEANTLLIRGSGVDLTKYAHTPLPLEVPIILLASRLLAEKGVREFVHAARVLRKKGISEQDARFVIVGEPDLANPDSIRSDELVQWTEEGIVELWGLRSDMPQVLAAAHLVVLPSYYGEGLPKVLIEAAACGRAVITTDHPGCRDAIDPGISGLLVPVRNSLALANAMETLIYDPIQCKIMGDAGRALAEKAFNVSQVVTAHLKIYQELIDKS
tara:strand:+ start:841 stop:2061 length:1221 start_codon:yes stop_codon:yes gene_type:complete